MEKLLLISCLYSLAYQLVFQGALAARHGDVRLINKYNLSSRCEGRLELGFDERFMKGWFAVCGNSFGAEEMQVVCQQLGCPYSNAYRTQIFKYGEVPTSVVAFQGVCTGSEVDLLHCNTDSAGGYTCSDTHAEDYIGIVCNEGYQSLKSAHWTLIMLNASILCLNTLLCCL